MCAGGRLHKGGFEGLMVRGLGFMGFRVQGFRDFRGILLDYIIYIYIYTHIYLYLLFLEGFRFLVSSARTPRYPEGSSRVLQGI